MGSKEHDECGGAGNADIGGLRDPENRIAVEQDVAQGAAADGGQAGHEVKPTISSCWRLATRAPVSAKMKTLA